VGERSSAAPIGEPGAEGMLTLERLRGRRRAGEGPSGDSEAFHPCGGKRGPNEESGRFLLLPLNEKSATVVGVVVGGDKGRCRCCCCCCSMLRAASAARKTTN